MREVMPEIAAWLDGLRGAFGRAAIDESIRLGLRGERIFHARENGHELGYPGPQGVQLSDAPRETTDPEPQRKSGAREVAMRRNRPFS